MPTIYAAIDDTVLAVAESDAAGVTAADSETAVGSDATPGEGWRIVERVGGDDRQFQCVDADPAAPERLFAGTLDGGLRRSVDGGRSWERVGAEAMHDRVMAVAVSPHDPAEVWAGTEPSAVYRSTDGGNTWSAVAPVADLPSAGEWYFPPRPDTHHVRWIEPDPNNRQRLYVGIEAGALLVTVDAGDRWRERPPGSRRDNHSLATHPDAPGLVYAAAGDGYAESTDGGRSWDHPQEGLDHRYCWSVAVDPADPDTVVLSSARGARSAHSQPAESYVYRREGDDAWTQVTDGLPTGEGVIRAVLAAGNGPGRIYAVTNRGLFGSADAGRTFARLDVDWPERFHDQAPRGLAVV